MVLRSVASSLAPTALTALIACSFLACSSKSTSTPDAASGDDSGDVGVGDTASSEAGETAVDAGSEINVSDAPDAVDAATMSLIKHVVIVVQENHTFDNHFGHYCTAAVGSNPTCTTGPTCCEGAPTADPDGNPLSLLDDEANADYSPDHTQACENAEIDNGKMDMFGKGPACANVLNLAVAEQPTVGPYWSYAANGAIADRYFQSATGQSSENDMYLARAQFVFQDNSEEPLSPLSGCAGAEPSGEKEYTDTTIGDLLANANVTWAWYAEGYQDQLDAIAAGTCEKAPPACPLGIAIYPCTFDPGDVPFLYYQRFVNDPVHIRDYKQLAIDAAAGNLPSVVFVKGYGFHSEHPLGGTTLTAGVTFVTDTISQIQATSAGSESLMLVTYDESGGYFDHIVPPAASTVDSQPYGPRIPLIAVGPFVKTNFISHTQMEHSSIVKFIEWNWLSGATGQLLGRDAVVNNLGSLLDSTKTGTAVPEQ